MLDKLKFKIAGGLAMTFLRSLATSKDTQSTLIGILAAAVVAVPTFNLSALLAGDLGQLTSVGSALAIALIGWLATKPGHDGSTTLLGAVAGGLHVLPTQTVESVSSAVILAMVGYVTNKPTATTAQPKTS